MTGDQNDVLTRLRAVLPNRWFPEAAPVLDAVLSGAAAVWSWVYGQLQVVRAQARIATASDVWLDMIASDYFGSRLRRAPGQGDESLRSAIKREMLRERATRAALEGALCDLTGQQPIIFEPLRPADTGAWGVASGWGLAGGWGSLQMPFQFLVTAFRTSGGGVAMVGGWGVPVAGWGVGTVEYANLAMEEEQVSDAAIAAEIVQTIPAATIAWLRITN
jgi:hypothetical protein